MVNPPFLYHLFGTYIIELGRFFKGKFTDFKIHESHDPLTCQVFFGTPRAAFRHYFDKFNGQIVLPMINYHLIDIERKVEFEPVGNYILKSYESYDPVTGKMLLMKPPGVFEITYNINLWNNDNRERDYMLHTLFNAFPKGEVSLIYYPDINNKTVQLLMPHKMELSTADETELEGLDQSETRDKIKTSFVIRCIRAFVPYDAKETEIVGYVSFANLMNDYINGEQITSTIYKLLHTGINSTNIKINVENVTVT